MAKGTDRPSPDVSINRENSPGPVAPAGCCGAKPRVMSSGEDNMVLKQKVVLRGLARACAVSILAGAQLASAQGSGPTLTPQNSGTTNRLQAVSPVNSDVVWASGLGGTFVVTTDGGEIWTAGGVPGAESVQFRDVQGVSRRIAYLLSSGVGTDSRIYKTVDGGETWTMQFQASDPNSFYDCFAFWTPKRGIVQGDGVNGKFPDLRTIDGVTWEDISNNLPPAFANEGSFAASGTCVATQGARNAWNTPLVGGTGTAGAFTVAFRDSRNGIVGGGDFLGTGPAVTAISGDGGQTWTLTNTPPVTGAIFGLSYVSRVGEDDGGDDAAVLITGPAGAAWTPDEG